MIASLPPPAAGGGTGVAAAALGAGALAADAGALSATATGSAADRSMISDSGAGLYACKATVDMFGLTKDSFVPQVDEVITVGEFYEKAAGGQIIFT